MRISDFDSHLTVEAEGRYRLVDLYDLFDRVQAESEKRGHHGVILDVTRISGTIPLMDMFVLGEHCSQVWKLSFRVALIPPEGGVYSFFENVACNRGVQVAVVSDYEAAMGWLTLPRVSAECAAVFNGVSSSSPPPL